MQMSTVNLWFFFKQGVVVSSPYSRSKSFSVGQEKPQDLLPHGIFRRVPENAEGVAVLVGQLPDLERPASAFVRLSEGRLIPHCLEV